MTVLFAVLAFALLFALYAVLEPRFGCRGACAGCDRACPRREGRGRAGEPPADAAAHQTGNGGPAPHFERLER